MKTRHKLFFYCISGTFFLLLSCAFITAGHQISHAQQVQVGQQYVGVPVQSGNSFSQIPRQLTPEEKEKAFHAWSFPKPDYSQLPEKYRTIQGYDMVALLEELRLMLNQLKANDKNAVQIRSYGNGIQIVTNNGVKPKWQQGMCHLYLLLSQLGMERQAFEIRDSTLPFLPNLIYGEISVNTGYQRHLSDMKSQLLPGAKAARILGSMSYFNEVLPRQLADATLKYDDVLTYRRWAKTVVQAHPMDINQVREVVEQLKKQIQPGTGGPNIYRACNYAVLLSTAGYHEETCHILQHIILPVPNTPNVPAIPAPDSAVFQAAVASQDFFALKDIIQAYARIGEYEKALQLIEQYGVYDQNLFLVLAYMAQERSFEEFATIIPKPTEERRVTVSRELILACAARGWWNELEMLLNIDWHETKDRHSIHRSNSSGLENHAEMAFYKAKQLMDTGENAKGMAQLKEYVDAFPKLQSSRTPMAASAAAVSPVQGSQQGGYISAPPYPMFPFHEIGLFLHRKGETETARQLFAQIDYQCGVGYKEYRFQMIWGDAGLHALAELYNAGYREESLRKIREQNSWWLLAKFAGILAHTENNQQVARDLLGEAIRQTKQLPLDHVAGQQIVPLTQSDALRDLISVRIELQDNEGILNTIREIKALEKNMQLRYIVFRSEDMFRYNAEVSTQDQMETAFYDAFCYFLDQNAIGDAVTVFQSMDANWNVKPDALADLILKLTQDMPGLSPESK